MTLHRRLCALACVRGPKTPPESTPDFLAISSPTGTEDLGDLDGSQVLFARLALDNPVPVTPHKTQQQKDPLNQGTRTAIRSSKKLDTKNADIKTTALRLPAHHGTKLAASLRSHAWLSFTMRSLLSAAACTVQFDIPFQKTDVVS